MEIKILYDNYTIRDDLISDHGFSCLLRAHGKTILFDTGADGTILLSNMKILGVDPLSVDEVFISHPHFDHIGGLSGFLNENNNVDVWVPFSFRGVRRAKKVVHIKDPMVLSENFFSTGELGGIEQSLAVKTEKGISLVVGCSHPD
ncbi:MBL fold metallo-hydrolase, partial [candidate division WOR-3 bacterium]|nr:MBL fold metallo-hydrolase [candidate division WOR-3 bacterium]